MVQFLQILAEKNHNAICPLILPLFLVTFILSYLCYTLSLSPFASPCGLHIRWNGLFGVDIVLPLHPKQYTSGTGLGNRHYDHDLKPKSLVDFCASLRPSLIESHFGRLFRFYIFRGIFNLVVFGKSSKHLLD
ncbi:hypothetical protein BDV27DRAFT_65018 [Aspergillus caelatus]|uniref:Uncharacterized protein n=2 Tax=Aspergillus subgen. Circumdati TaxID=2720871 RepID=A0A5N6ZMA6_9EURO|nr:uncharacterized protein BDV27DRAFT_65018 [Aspergillus caelatus]KAE8358741.1 hypothetical protein BDV27DRAFT_65018 [Aspergillus caelatus]KAE8410769.1 hypothetical protein BDV36DRAFT_110421 [Aspergillus pseudocaelatus]